MNKKALSLTSLRKKVRALQRRGKKSVFTNGCFDILHVGHVRYLARARALGDCLVVAVNTDASVRRLKGTTRPITPQRDRLEVLAALSSVDYLLLFGEKTPLKAITALGPDVLVKGGDWALDQIVGRDEVERRGGKVVRIKTVEGASTTHVIERILKRFRVLTP
jgi:D-beta-D-heptose 7-phosphate kinase/D-beta-D-heptose 1-phosphate adenosyltransferase